VCYMFICIILECASDEWEVFKWIKINVGSRFIKLNCQKKAKLKVLTVCSCPLLSFASV